MELLAPAGNFLSLKAAVQNGADAVYLAGQHFGARAFAGNFTNEEIIEAINYAHSFNVKIYITINTIIYDKDMSSLIKFVKFLMENKVDGVIVQDLGVLNRLRICFPNLEVHASTQMHVHNLNGALLLKKLGVKRVVLARETPLSLIKEIKEKSNLEIEVFGHGALCISYSGQCLMSSMIGGRSANAGACAQPCRQAYKLVKKIDNELKTINTTGDYLLSSKDLYTLDKVPSLIESKIDSLKIEGRMKRPEYVALTTKLYREAIDGKLVNLDEALKELKQVFNREFTKGHIFNESKDLIVNDYRPNHIGIKVGIVKSFDKNYVDIKLNEELKLQDGVRFLNKEDEGFTITKMFIDKHNVKEAKEGDLVRLINNNYQVNIGDILVKTTNQEQLMALAKTYESDHKKILIDGTFNMDQEGLSLSLIDKEGNEVTEYISYEFEKANNISIKEIDIREKLNKTNNTVYQFNNLEINFLPEYFLPISLVNKLRQSALEKLDKVRLEKYNYEVIEKPYQVELPIITLDNLSFNYVVNDEKDLEIINKYHFGKIYVKNPNIYHKIKASYPQVYLYISNVLEKHLDFSTEKLLVSELGSLNYGVNNRIITDYTFNVVNKDALAFLYQNNARMVTLSLEIKYDQIKELVKEFNNTYKQMPNIEVVIYTNPEVMTSKYCFKKKYLGGCSNCNLVDKYYLVDKFNNKMSIRSENCLTKIYHYQDINEINNIQKYLDLGINNFRIDLVNKDINEKETILNNLIKYLK